MPPSWTSMTSCWPMGTTDLSRERGVIGDGLPRTVSEVRAEQLMRRALEVAEQTPAGDIPVGAVVFGPDDKVIAAGVNRVMPHATSLAHAENMAYMLAQQRLQTPRLNAVLSPVTLATSSQPCCQCYGATVWAGIDRLLIGARAEDVEALTTFDEGPLPADWVGELEQRGIAVLREAVD